MISAGRCNSSGGGRTMAKAECRVVNGGGGYVNHCEQVLDDQNEVVLAAANIAVAAGGDLHKLPVSMNGGYPLEDEFDNLKDFTIKNFEIMDQLQKLVEKQDKEIKELNKKLNYTTLKLDNANRKLSEIEAREEPLNVLPFTPVSSTCSSGIGNLNSAEIHEQQDVKPKRSRNRQVAIKQPVSNPLESNPTKRQRIRNTRAKSSDLDKMQELSLITADTAYYTCLGNYDPIKDDPVPQNSSSNLEIPSWRIKTYSSWYSMEGTENMSDDIFENRHSRLELCERKRKRWDMQRLREIRRIEYLKEGRKKHHLQNDVDKEELTTLLPNPANIKAIEITDNLPVSAFGSNLLIKKKLELYKFYHSQWYNDGTQVPQEQRNVRGLRSSGCNQFYDTLRVNL